MFERSAATTRRLSRPSGLALYRQLADRLRKDLVDGLRRLPTERELAGVHGVARVTVRAALDLLAHEGLIDRRRRLGTTARLEKRS
jgi:GntR family transcriptional regulator